MRLVYIGSVSIKQPGISYSNGLPEAKQRIEREEFCTCFWITADPTWPLAILAIFPGRASKYGEWKPKKASSSWLRFAKSKDMRHTESKTKLEGNHQEPTWNILQRTALGIHTMAVCGNGLRQIFHPPQGPQ